MLRGFFIFLIFVWKKPIWRSLAEKHPRFVLFYWAYQQNLKPLMRLLAQKFLAFNRPSTVTFFVSPVDVSDLFVSDAVSVDVIVSFVAETTFV